MRQCEFTRIDVTRHHRPEDVVFRQVKHIFPRIGQFIVQVITFDPFVHRLPGYAERICNFGDYATLLAERLAYPAFGNAWSHRPCKLSSSFRVIFFAGYMAIRNRRFRKWCRRRARGELNLHAAESKTHGCLPRALHHTFPSL